MPISTLKHLLIISCLSFVITACGGGGGGGNAATGNGAGGSGNTGNVSGTGGGISSISASSSSSNSVQQPAALTRTNTPVIISNYMDLVLFAKETAATIVQGEYNTGLTDGVYKNKCENDKGSYEITISSFGDQLSQKYTNCELTIVQDGLSNKVLISGEESIATIRNGYPMPSVNITWKNYSISTNGTTAMTIDGTFAYQGWLSFYSTAQYDDTTAKVTINARITENSKTSIAEGVTFTFDFPAIFNRYAYGGGIGWSLGFYYVEPKDLRRFATKIFFAQGSLSTEGITTNFSLDVAKQRVSFSNSALAKSYLDTAENGFFIRWDKDNDGLMDANVFLSETEYPVFSEHLSDQNSPVYFTHYKTSTSNGLPPGHSSEGKYDWINLSKGTTGQINVQELFTTQSGALLTYEIDNQKTSNDWEQTEAGRFTLKFPNSDGTETYELHITAIDSNNNRSPVITATIHMNNNLTDTDKDGILDIRDPDIDNDGVPNEYDRFPKDPTEWADLDLDGIGDNTDTDLDNDGIPNAEDLFPRDGNCLNAEDGDQYGCYITSSNYAFNDGNSTVYFLQTIYGNKENKIRFVRFDINTHKFLTPSPMLDVNAGYVSVVSFNPAYNSVLVQDNLAKKLYLINLDDFSKTAIRDMEDIYVLSSSSEKGYFILSMMEDFTTTWLEVFDHNGVLVDSNKTTFTNSVNPPLTTDHVPFCQPPELINNDGMLITHNGCLAGVPISPNQLYAIDGIKNLQMHGVYDTNDNTVFETWTEQLQWFNNTVVYMDWDNYQQAGKLDLIMNDFTNHQEKHYENQNNDYFNTYVVGQKIVLFSDPVAPFTQLIVLDKDLTPEFDSLAK